MGRVIYCKMGGGRVHLEGVGISFGSLLGEGVGNNLNYPWSRGGGHI